ncbi:23S rRNA (pseudouridine(1915)-N(3))-methyltransferase RlmH [Spiroplasma endosymbiont of Panorpa germanica]|uniref:23S rRNA (pseudouridine(1915)-N(3))-methyltransferase RlmH n=1 Tax=Spiroplasma endosymbiont of Panorpa germanica TaxID=3066314 RepID=UPI0030D37522
MKLKLITFGKMDKSYLKEANQDYLSRIKKFADFEVIELNEQSSLSLLKAQKIQEEAVLTILEKISTTFEVFLLDINGVNYNSVDFAKIIDDNKNFKSGKLAFIVGPSEGFSDNFKTQFHKISFGKATFPHQLFRVMLLEQIYRSFKIINNEKYHK